MINRKFQLTNPYLFELSLEEFEAKSNEVIVQPTKLSICAADLRYYKGDRDEKVLREKLPLALIHEAIGTVLHDPTGTFNTGDSVVMIPNIPTRSSTYKENYDRTSKFKSSSEDGFMQDFIGLSPDRLISINGIDEDAAVMLELISVVYNSLSDMPKDKINNNSKIGIWGNGNLGYLLTLIIRHHYPEADITVFGRTTRTSLDFLSANSIYNINDDLSDVEIDIAFECVGGLGSEKAINQIIDLINPQGYISILGVSENYPSLNTRMILEKGITVQGSSRSGRDDFLRGVEFLTSNKKNQENTKRLITERIDIMKIEDIARAFSISSDTKFKTVMNWKL